MCFCAHARELRTIAVLSTGGTIASKYDPVKGGYVPSLSGQDLVAAVPAVKKIAQIRVEQISNIPSPESTPEIWIRLATRVNSGLPVIQAQSPSRSADLWIAEVCEAAEQL